MSKFSGGEVVMIIGAVFLFISVLARSCAPDNGYKGGACFANGTCMPQLSCFDDDSKRGICVAPLDGGATEPRK